MHKPLIAAALIALSACAADIAPGVPVTGRAIADAFFDTPFADGQSVAVLVKDPDPLRVIQTYRLVPCQDGRAVCAAGDPRFAGTLTLENGQYVVRESYPGRVFYLDRNGDGFMGVQTGAQQVLTPLAWN
ncbi:hypothetical protein SAMN04488003_102132 [Loktanella fryxellensis]|uniref:Lipoprotein n=1 Tax=Loktanella fryxellensis TaxID=245187 RepID=A0A1H7ZU64_9RHOB|nr:hypothetical protein [Loktanella fryxellensis]SEM61816.1 hypothetical protein SAMN04488003_102132 [Loktanella fryxellensis]